MMGNTISHLYNHFFPKHTPKQKNFPYEKYWHWRNFTEDAPNYIDKKLHWGEDGEVDCIMYNTITGEVYDTYRDYLARTKPSVNSCVVM